MEIRDRTRTKSLADPIPEIRESHSNHSLKPCISKFVSQLKLAKKKFIMKFKTTINAKFFAGICTPRFFKQ